MTRRLQDNLTTAAEWAAVLFFLSWVVRELLPLPVVKKSLIGSFLSLSVSENAGFVFGLPLPMPITLIITAVILGLVSWYFILSLPFTVRERLLSVGFGLIVGGGAANFFERISKGYVTDYIIISINGLTGSWNVADIAIIIGIILWIIAAGKEDREMYKTSHTLEI